MDGISEVLSGLIFLSYRWGDLGQGGYAGPKSYKQLLGIEHGLDPKSSP